MENARGHLFWNNEIVGIISSISIEYPSMQNGFYQVFHFHSNREIANINCEVYTYLYAKEDVGIFDVDIFNKIREDRNMQTFTIISPDCAFTKLMLKGLRLDNAPSIVKEPSMTRRTYLSEFEFLYDLDLRDKDAHELVNGWNIIRNSESEEELKELTLHKSSLIRCNIFKNNYVTKDIAAMLLLDKDMSVRKAAIKWMKEKKEKF